MKNLLIGTTAAYASGITGITDINSLANGSIACIDENGALVNGGAPVITTNKVTFYLGRTTYGPKKGMTIDRTTFAYDKRTFVAAADRVVVIGSDGTNTTADMHYPTLVDGDVASINIVDLEKHTSDPSRVKTYSVEVAGHTATTLTAALVAKINADPNVCVVALDQTAGADYGFKCTGKHTTGWYYGYRFAVYGTGICEDADIIIDCNGAGTACEVNGVYASAATTVTLATLIGTATSEARTGSKGVGSQLNQAALLELEKQCSTHDGNTDFINLVQATRDASRVVTATDYTVYAIPFYASRPNAPMIQSDVATMVQYIAVPNGSALQTAIDLILAAL
jgi:hypothetical protein